MLVGGIDAGTETIKAVILKDRQMVSWASGPAGFDVNEAAALILKEALVKAGVPLDSLERVVATGKGKERIKFPCDKVSDALADALGALWFFPAARTVIDIGAEQSLAIRCDADGEVLAVNQNDKCAAGAGSFIKTMARALEVNIEDMGRLSSNSTRQLSIEATCAVFAESEVVSLIHSGYERADIARAIHEAVAGRTAAIVRPLGIEKEVAFVGGVSKNAGVVDCMASQLGVAILIPPEPTIAGAVGAALSER